MYQLRRRLPIIIASLLMVFLNISSVSTTKAITGSDWMAGNIISDDQFFKPGSMSTNEIQNFLNSMVPTCDTNGTGRSEFGGGTRAQYGASIGYPAPYTCLKDYVENPTTHQNNANGGTVTGGLSSAQIIKYASDTYGVSPKTLLVLLQKEQTLVTDVWPFPTQYRSATGYGCPDTAPCDAEYYGLYNQVVNAARQFQLYAKYPNNYRYKAFQANSIQWNPSTSCGASAVYIANQATAGLYNYTPYQPNAAALNNLYGSGDSCSAYGNRNFWRIYNDWFGSTQISETFIEYKAHVSTLGWQGYKQNSDSIGTTGQAKSIEAFRINGPVEYSSYNNDFGWQPTVSDGMASGTTGLGRPINAVKINPTGTLATKYDIYYRAHVSSIGWMGWVKNGEPAGVTGDSSKRIESIEIRLIVKGFGISGTTENGYINSGVTSPSSSVGLSVSSHVSNIGWQPYVESSMASGTTDRSKSIEAIKISLVNPTASTGGIKYSSHLAGTGWQSFVADNAVSGTTGQSRQMESIRIVLTGEIADQYDIAYRAHVQNLGWLGWVKNGEPSGSVGAGLRIESIEARIVAKGSQASIYSTGLYNPSRQSIPETYSLLYSTHLAGTGWTSSLSQGSTTGTTGQSRAIESLRIDSISSTIGNISITCTVYVRGTGWTASTPAGSVCGTTGQSKPIEAVRLSLTGADANKYDILYQTHSSNIGWQNWYKNGEASGTPAAGTQIEAIVIKLVDK